MPLSPRIFKRLSELLDVAVTRAAIVFPRFNTDGTVSQRTVAELRSDIGLPASPIPKFSAQAAASTTPLTTGVPALAEFTVERFDVGSNYDAGNARFVAPVTGYYQFNVGVRWASLTTGNVYCSFLYVNGARVRDFDQGISDGNPIDTGGSALVALNATDYVEVFIYASFSAGAKMEAGQYCHFDGSLVQ